MATTVTSSTKKKTVRMNGCVASAQAAKYADVDVITAYPIRPYTATMMALAQMVANGDLDAEYIVADSERSEEHTSELQSRRDLVCRLLLEKKKKNYSCNQREKIH